MLFKNCQFLCGRDKNLKNLNYCSPTKQVGPNVRRKTYLHTVKVKK